MDTLSDDLLRCIFEMMPWRARLRARRVCRRWHDAAADHFRGCGGLWQDLPEQQYENMMQRACEANGAEMVLRLSEVFGRGVLQCISAALFRACIDDDIPTLQYICRNLRFALDPARSWEVDALYTACAYGQVSTVWSVYEKIVRDIDACRTRMRTRSVRDDVWARHCFEYGDVLTGSCGRLQEDLHLIQYLHVTVGIGVGDARADNGNALFTACLRGHKNIVRYLCDVVGLCARDVRSWSYTPLLAACRWGHTGVVRYLCEDLKLGDDILSGVVISLSAVNAISKPAFYFGSDFRDDCGNQWVDAVPLGECMKYLAKHSPSCHALALELELCQRNPWWDCQ